MTAGIIVFKCILDLEFYFFVIQILYREIRQLIRINADINEENKNRKYIEYTHTNNKLQNVLDNNIVRIDTHDTDVWILSNNMYLAFGIVFVFHHLVTSTTPTHLLQAAYVIFFFCPYYTVTSAGSQ